MIEKTNKQKQKTKQEQCKFQFPISSIEMYNSRHDFRTSGAKLSN